MHYDPGGLGDLTACATGAKKPERIRAAMKDSKLGEAAAHITVIKAITVYQKRTGSLPKYAERVTTQRPAAPIMNKLPTKA